MSLRNNLLSIFILPSLLLIGCGGGGDFDLGNGDGDLGGDNATETEEEGSSTNTSTVSYLPLTVYEKFQSYSGFSGDGLFQGERQYPYIPVHMISPINASTLQSTSTALASDYKVTIDDIEIDPTENYPVLQKVIGNPVFLKTALVFDLTGSTSEVDLAALVSEAKSYIAKAQAHSNSIISEQQFVIWSFGETNPAVENVVELTSGFTSDVAVLEAALDSLQLKPSAPSSLHKAVVKVIGRFTDDSVTPEIDYATDGNNDLYDIVTSNGIQLSQMVLFSSGPDNLLEFDQEQMVQAIESQGFLEFNIAEPEVTDNFTNKAVFYYVLGASSPGNAYQALSDVSEKVGFLTLSSGSYNFSDSLLDDQVEAIDARIDLDNQYIYRYAFLPRQGEHTAIFSSKTENFNYSLTSQYDAEDFPDLGATPPDPYIGTPAFELSSLVEITGPSGEYLSGDEASLSQVTTFRPATRWTSEIYASSDYTWSITNGTGTANADGSYTVNTVVGASATLRVNNTARSEFAVITVTN